MELGKLGVWASLDGLTAAAGLEIAESLCRMWRRLARGDPGDSGTDSGAPTRLLQGYVSVSI
jgi:hypothetical protein